MDITRQGECGQNAKWSLTSENTLIISGEGRMKDYEIRSSYYDNGSEPFMNVINDDYLVPWRDYSNDITKIVIEEGITYIGSFAFCNFQSLESVILPHSLSEIGICSFAVCPHLVDINLNPEVKIAEWAFFGSKFIVTENDDTSFEIPPETLKKLKERLDPIMEDFFNSIKKPSSHKKSDSPLTEEKYDICISHFGIKGFSTEVESDGFPVTYIDSPTPNDTTIKRIRESWKGHFFYSVAEDYFQGLYLNSYNKERQLLNKEENNLAEIDNYYLSLLIRNAIIRYQYAKNTIKLLNEVTEENITDYAESQKKELSQVDLGIVEPPKSSIAFRLGRLYEYLENVLDSKKALSALGFDNVDQEVSNWLSSGIDSVDGDILCSDKITLNNLVKAYLDCQKKILYENDRTKIAMWYLISSCKLTNHDYRSVDESYIGELRIKHQWLVNNLSFDILCRMMYPPEYGCEVDGWFDNVEVYLRKDVIDDYPLSSLYVEDELLRGANIYIHELLKRDGLGPYIYHEIYNDNKKNEILKYIGLYDEDEDGVNSNAEFNPDVTSDSESLSTVPKDEEDLELMNEQSEATTAECKETEDTSDNECNNKYPLVLHKRKRLRNNTLIDEVCKKYLSEWFKNGIHDVSFIKHVFFECGTPPTEKLIFTGDIKDLVSFLLFLNNGSGTKKIWDYINLFIVDMKGQPVLKSNPRSNVAKSSFDIVDEIRYNIRQKINRKLKMEEEEDLK